MIFKSIFLILISVFILSCEKQLINKDNNLSINIEDRYRNIGFALVYNNDLSKIKKLEERSLKIYHKSLKKNQ